jgi:hypothetical protein
MENGLWKCDHPNQSLAEFTENIATGRDYEQMVSSEMVDSEFIT